MASPASSERNTLTMKATMGVRQLVLEGHLSPGDRVQEVALAERLGVSRTPLRIALVTLAHEGLVEPLPNGGFVVCSITKADIRDAIELRGVLEGTAARFAAERLASPAQLNELTRICARLDHVVEALTPELLVPYVELNDEYHRELVELARSATLTRAIANVAALPFASPSAFLSSQAVLPRAQEILVVAQHHHRVLLDAIRTGSGARAEGIAREHAHLAQLTLDLVLDDHDALAGTAGGPLLRSVV
jgi:GntR family transcriptional regulator, vanillate catabolism transcriptional regulator